MKIQQTVSRWLPAHRTALLTASAIGIYLLFVVGATTAILDGAAACPTWPGCDAASPATLLTPAYLAAVGHRIVTVLVGLLLLATLGAVWLGDSSRRVTQTVSIAAALFPVQIGVGAATALSNAAGALPEVHLLLAMSIFSLVFVALLWHLEALTTGEAPRSPATNTIAEPSPVPDADDPSERDEPDVTGGEVNEPTAGGWRGQATAYVRMTKPKLWWLLCLVALASMGLAAGPDLDGGLVVATLAGGVLAIAASGTFNNVLERDVDRRMARTADRPLVVDQIPVSRAVAFGLALAAASVAVFVAFVNVLAAVLGLGAILFYSVVYTLVLKPNTTQNIVLGGAVGAFPAFIGWAAVTDTVGVPALVLGAVIFLWTPAHFYNLALVYREDYERGGFPMLPVVHGAATTRRHILLYLGATMLAAVALGATSTLGPLYALTVVVLGAVFLWAVVGLFRERTERAAFRAFHAANAYLGGVLVVILLEGVVV